MEQTSLATDLSHRRVRLRALSGEMARVMPSAQPLAALHVHTHATKTGWPPLTPFALRRIHFLPQRFGLGGLARSCRRKTSHGTWQRPDLASRQINPQISPTVVFYINL